jgi:NADH-quinone oxidoreductase subunit H
MIVQGLIHTIILSLLLIIPIIVSVAFFTLAERKVMAAIQRRRGPNVVGI